MADLNTVTADFTSSFGPFTPFGTGSATLVGGRARIACQSAAYSGIKTALAFTLQNASVFARMYAPAQGGAATEASLAMYVEGAAGDRIAATINAAGNTISFANQTGYFDAGALTIAYSAVTHAWCRLRELSGTLYWETSPDALTWTIRRSIASPAWVASLTTQSLQCQAHRDSGTVDFGEVDNVNVPTGGGTGALNLWRPAHAQNSLTGYGTKFELWKMFPVSAWTGPWDSTATVQATISAMQSAATAAGQVLPLTIYGFNGASTLPNYEAWIDQISAGIGSGICTLIIEPDALGLGNNMGDGTTPATAVSYAVTKFKTSNTNAQVNIDSSMWLADSIAADRLQSGNISQADGFSLNTSAMNDLSTCYTQGDDIYSILVSRGVNNKKYTIDTSRNGNGPLTSAFGPNGQPWIDASLQYMNPPGRGAGLSPRLAPDNAHPNCKSILWVKSVGESDGTFPTFAQSPYYGESAPAAGVYWQAWVNDFLTYTNVVNLNIAAVQASVAASTTATGAASAQIVKRVDAASAATASATSSAASGSGAAIPAVRVAAAATVLPIAATVSTVLALGVVACASTVRPVTLTATGVSTIISVVDTAAVILPVMVGVASAFLSPDVVLGVGGVGAGSVLNIASVTVTVIPVLGVVTVGTVAIPSGSAISVSVVSGVAIGSTLTVNAGSIMQPATVARSVTVPTPVIAAVISATVPAAAFSRTFSIPAVAVRVDAQLAVGVVGGTAATQSVIVSVAATIQVAAAGGSVSVPPVTVLAGTVFSVTQVPGTAAIRPVQVLTASSTVIPVNAVFGVGQVTAGGITSTASATLTITVVPSVAFIGTVAVKAGAQITAAPITAANFVPIPGLLTASVLAPAVVNAAGTVNAVGLQTGSAVTIIVSTVPAASAVPPTTPLAGAQVLPAVAPATSQTQTATATLGQNVTVTTVSSAESIPLVVTMAGSIISASAVSLAAEVRSPNILTSSAISLSPLVIGGASTVLTSTIRADAQLTCTTVPAATSVGTVAIATGTRLTTTAVVGAASTPTPIILTGSRLTPLVVWLVAELGTNTVQTSSTATIAVTSVTATAVTRTVGVAAGLRVTETVMTASTIIEQPTIITGSLATPSVYTQIPEAPPVIVNTGSVLNVSRVQGAAGFPGGTISTSLTLSGVSTPTHAVVIITAAKTVIINTPVSAHVDPIDSKKALVDANTPSRTVISSAAG